MRHIIHIGAKQFRNESEVPYTHVLIGQRDKEHFRPNIEQKRISLVGPRQDGIAPLTEDEKITLMQFSRDEIEGRFAIKPLIWCASEGEAEAAMPDFPAPEWINLSVAPVAAVIRNG